MVDPPPHSSKYLREFGINPRLIRGIILTHCHADHDAGTFQKILEEGRVQLMTTLVVKNSFIRKYAAISGLKAEYLEELFYFREVIVGEPINVYGGILEFFYSLHTIPCVGFSAHCGGKSMVYSADTFNDPKGIEALFEKGTISKQRRDKLIDFQWHHDVILHEAGVPPIHTPLETLSSLPEEVKERLYIVHKKSSTIPVDSGLKSAGLGPVKTIVILDDFGPECHPLELMELFSSIDLFSEFPMSRGIDVLSSAAHHEFEVGEHLVEEGSIGSEVFIIAMGHVGVFVKGEKIKEFTVGDHFGETSILTAKSQARTATITALTKVEAYTIKKEGFQHLIRESDAIGHLVNLGKMQMNMSWQSIEANSFLRTMTSSQKTAFQTLLTPYKYTVGQPVWLPGAPADSCILVESAEFQYKNVNQVPFREGAFIGEIPTLELLHESIFHPAQLQTHLECTKDGTAYVIEMNLFLHFLSDNPGLKVACAGRLFFEGNDVFN